MTKAKKTAISGIAGIFLMYAAFSYTLKSSFFQKYFTKMMENATQWSIAFHAVDINIIRGLLRFEDVHVRDPKSKLHLQAEHLLVNFDFLSLFLGKLTVSDFIVDHPIVEFVRPQEKEKKEKTPIRFGDIQNKIQKASSSFLLQSLVLENATFQNIVVRDDRDHEYLLERARVEIAPTLLRDIKAALFLEGFSGNLPPIDRIIADFKLTPEGIDIKNFELRMPKVILNVAAHTGGNAKEGRFDLSSKIQAPATLPQPILVSVESRILGQKALIQKLEASFEKNDKELKNAIEGNGHLIGTGFFDLDTLRYELAFDAKDVSLEAIFSKLPSPVLGPAKGRAEVSGKAEGQLPEISVQSRATINDLHHGPLYVKKAQGSLVLKWPELSWDAEVKGGEDLKHEAHVVGAVEFPKSKETGRIQAGLKTLVADFENARLEDLIPKWKASGNVIGQLLLKGAPMGSVQGTGHLVATQGKFLFQPIEELETNLVFKPGGTVVFNKTHLQPTGISAISWDGELTFTGSNEEDGEKSQIRFFGELDPGVKVKGFYEKESDTFKIENFQIFKDKNTLNFNLTAVGSEETANSKIDAQLKGLLNLDWLRFFPIYFHEGHGMADIDLRYVGSSTNPVLKGQVKFLESDILLRGFGEELNNLSGTVRIDGTTLIPELSGELGDGKFILNGRVGLNQGKPENANLIFRGNNLTFSKNNVYRLDFDADVNLTGKFPSPLLSGKIDIIEGRYIKPFVIRDLVLKPFEEPSEPTELELSLAPVGLDLSVRNSGDLRVRNNIATIFLQSNLQIHGTFGKPKIAGALSVTEGTFRFLGREFTLNEGLVEYSNPLRNEPYLTLSAQQDIPVDQPRYTVYVDIRGFLDNLAIQLSSSPSLEKQDIVSLLAFGATQEEIRQSGASKRTLTSGVLGEELSTVVAAPLAKTTKIDIFRLEASESGNLSRFSVGKRISDRFTLEFINDLDPVTAEKTFQANYYLTDTVLLKGYRKSLLGFDPRYELNLLLRFRLH